MKRLLIPVFFFITLLSQAQKDVSFVEECIDFKMDTARFAVNGIFIFSNAAGHRIKKSILFPFPFPVDSIEAIRIYNMSGGKNMDYRLTGKGVLFEMEAEPYDTISLNIAYHQPVKKENTYMLRSTVTWGEPLKRARYTLSVEDTSVIEGFSCPPDSVSDNLYFWDKHNFLPQKDFTIVLK